MYKLFLFVILSAVMSGCSNMSGNMPIGTETLKFNLPDQREALRVVLVTDTIPMEAEYHGDVDASRCHRNTLEAQPTEDMLIDDLRIYAYSKGADGIYDIDITKETGLLKNCWYVITGNAKMFIVKNK